MSDDQVRNKLMAAIWHVPGMGSETAYKIADRILQSQALRVTLVEPRYKVSRTFSSPNHLVLDNRSGGAICEFYASAGAAEESARHLADWLNAKEPE